MVRETPPHAAVAARPAITNKLPNAVTLCMGSTWRWTTSQRKRRRLALCYTVPIDGFGDWR